MLLKFLPLLPEISLVMMLITMFFVQLFRENKTPKTFFSLSKYFLAVSLLSAVVFYNKSIFPQFENTSFTSLMKVIVYLLAGVWFFLSYKWFLNMNQEAFKYYFMAGIFILLASVGISCRNFAWFAFLVPGLVLCAFLMGKEDGGGEDNGKDAYSFFYAGVFFSLLNLAGIWLLYKNGAGLGFDSVQAYFDAAVRDKTQCFWAVLLLLPWLFLAGGAPFQMPMLNFSSKAVLPVYGFLNLVPQIFYWAVVINLLAGPLKPVQGALMPVLAATAYLSMLWGALGAGAENNLQRLFGFNNLFHCGVIFLCLSFFDQGSVSAAIIYGIIFLLTSLGVYTAVLGCKSKGEYLSDLDALRGMAQEKPYISAAFLILLFSFLGNPPLLGFIGLLGIVDNLFASGNFYPVFAVLCMLCLLAHAYLRIIQTIYFAQKQSLFDRADKGIYISLMFNLLLIVFAILKPRLVINDINLILSAVF